MNARLMVLHEKYTIRCGEQLWSVSVLATSSAALAICLITFFVVPRILGRQGKPTERKWSHRWSSAGQTIRKDVARMLKKDGSGLWYPDRRPADYPGLLEIQNSVLHGQQSRGRCKSGGYPSSANHALPWWYGGDGDRSGNLLKLLAIPPSIKNPESAGMPAVPHGIL